MKTKILMSIMVIIVAASMIVGATMAYFSDTETSTGNTFTAGTLDLQIDGGDVNVVKFNVNNMRPGNQPKASYVLSNIGSINGKLNITGVAVQNLENGITEPEAEAGDVTDPLGELGDVVNIRLFIDYNGDGWISTGDNVFYNGKVSSMPASFNLDEPVAAGASLKIVALLDWWNTPDDNKAQGDTMIIDFTFELKQ